MLQQIFVIATLAPTAFSASSGGGTLSSLPACAQTCLQNATAASASCSPVDISCLCSSTLYLNTLACCLSRNCNQADQTSAANFNSQVCENVNVTMPFFVGCPSETTTDSRGSTTTILTNSAGGTVSDQVSSSSTSFNTGTVEAGPSVATTGPLATFTGGPLLTGTCTMPQIASVTLDAGEILEYPWMGCSKEAPDCCPFDIGVGGRLSICPHDYFTTSNACCPTGWSVYTSALAGETPCYKTSSLAAQSPNVSLAASEASATLINNEAFTLRYALAPPKQPALSLGVKIGIAIGAAGGGAIALLALAIFIRKRRAQKRAQRDEANMPKPESASMYQRGFSGSQTGLSELPSPQTIRPPTPPLPDNAPWFNMPLGSHAPNRVMTPTELAGSTYINEHHPAYGVSPVTPNVNGFHDVPGPPEELAGDDPMRRTVSRETARAESVRKDEGMGGSPLKGGENAGDAG